MIIKSRVFLLTFILLLPLGAIASENYYPPYGNWQRTTPQAAGINAAKLAQAVNFAQSKAVIEPKDLAQAITDSFSPREPDFRILGPTGTRGPGLVKAVPD